MNINQFLIHVSPNGTVDSFPIANGEQLHEVSRIILEGMLAEGGLIGDPGTDVAFKAASDLVSTGQAFLTNSRGSLYEITAHQVLSMQPFYGDTVYRQWREVA